MEGKMKKLASYFMSLDSFGLNDYYLYIKEHGKRTVVGAFKIILLEYSNNKEIFDKFFDAFFSIELESMEIAHDSYIKLTRKYGEERIDNYFKNLLTINNSNSSIRKKFEHIYFYVDLHCDEEIFEDEKYKGSDIVKDYLGSITYKLLSKEEEKNVFSRIKECRDTMDIAFLNDEDNIYFYDFYKVISSIKTKEQLKKIKIISDYLSDEDLNIYKKEIYLLNKSFNDQNTFYLSSGDLYDSEYLEQQLNNIISLLDLRKLVINSNLRLVISIAKRYQGMGVELIDLIQDGNIGLVKAVTRYDISKGTRFSTYATWWIRQGVTRSISDSSRTVRIPVHRHEKMIKVASAIKKLEAIYGYNPSNEEIANYLKYTTEEVKTIKDDLNYNNIISLDYKMAENDNNGSELIDLIASKEESAENLCSKKELTKIFSELFTTLTEREAEVIRYRFGFYGGREYTLEEIGEKYGVTRERVRQIENKAIRKLRHPTRSRKLSDYHS